VAGVVYCLTVRDVERVASWLRLHGHDVLPYTGGTDGEDRLDAEGKLQRNEVKALVATSALGMGYDKPDLGFVVHFQAPGSPVAYYQQVGRAGRQLDVSVGVLLRGVEDRDIQDWFITTAFPDSQDVDAVLAVFASAPGPVTFGHVLDEVNIKRGDVELVLKQLTVDGVLRRLSGQTYERTLKPWVYPTKRVQAVTADRRLEQDQMTIYAVGGICRMEFLTTVLDDPDPQPCGMCDLCSGERFVVALDESLVAEAERFVRCGFVVIEPRRRKLNHTLGDELRLERGRALCLWNDAGWGKLVADGKRGGHFDDRLISALADMVREWVPDPMPTWVTYVPSLRHPGLVADLACRFAEMVGLPVVPLVGKLRETQPQKGQQNASHQEANVRGAFALVDKPLGEPLFLIDDLVDSRWTLVEIGALLRQHGSGLVYPLVLGSLQGRDS
jgi:ATP-dependent DNA helicase RecQ